MSVQVGTYSPGMFQDFFLLRDGQQYSPLPEFPDVKPKKVKPSCDMHYPGFGCTECHPSFLEKFFQSRSGVGFQYFPCWGHCHKVIGIANDCNAFIDASALSWGFGPSICVFRVEQAFHPIQGNVREQWGDDSSLWCPCFRGRVVAEFDHPRFQPTTQRRREHRQLGQQGRMVNIVKRAINLMPPSRTQR